MTLVSEANTLSTVMVAEPNPETVLERNRVQTTGHVELPGTAEYSLIHLCVCTYMYVGAEVNIKCVP